MAKLNLRVEAEDPLVEMYLSSKNEVHVLTLLSLMLDNGSRSDTARSSKVFNFFKFIEYVLTLSHGDVGKVR